MSLLVAALQWIKFFIISSVALLSRLHSKEGDGLSFKSCALYQILKAEAVVGDRLKIRFFSLNQRRRFR